MKNEQELYRLFSSKKFLKRIKDFLIEKCNSQSTSTIGILGISEELQNNSLYQALTFPKNVQLIINPTEAVDYIFIPFEIMTYCYESGYVGTLLEKATRFARQGIFINFLANSITSPKGSNELLSQKTRTANTALRKVLSMEEEEKTIFWADSTFDQILIDFREEDIQKITFITGKAPYMFCTSFLKRTEVTPEREKLFPKKIIVYSNLSERNISPSILLFD